MGGRGKCREGGAGGLGRGCGDTEWGKGKDAFLARTPTAETLPSGLDWHGALLPAAWQGVERDLRSQVSGSERGLVQEYVEKAPNPSLKSEWAGRPLPVSHWEAAGQGGRDPGLPEVGAG